MCWQTVTMSILAGAHACVLCFCSSTIHHPASSSWQASAKCQGLMTRLDIRWQKGTNARRRCKFTFQRHM